MSSDPQPSCGNLLLRALEPADFALLRPHLERVPLIPEEIIAVADQPIQEICFPEDGVVSFQDVLNDGSRVGLGMIGREGMAGWPALLGGAPSSHEANVAIGGGTALRIDAANLISACGASPGLNNLLLRFVQYFTIQLGRTLVSNLGDPVERRLARWLLMNHDRIEGDDIALTHHQLGVMLGVRRASVTDTLHVLEGEHAIQCTRGHIAIRDRCRLRQMAGEAYGFAEAEYARLIAPFGKG